MTQPLLSLTGIRKTFGGTHALSDAHLNLYAGEVTALIGENGAGKSTLVKILSGFHQPDAGDIHLDGTAVRIRDAAQAQRLGITVVHQECVVFDNLSVAENIFIGARSGRFVSWDDMRARAAKILGQLDASFDPDMPAGRLSIAQKHIVQISRALTSDARVLILDEPTAALSHREAEDLLRITRRIAQSGCAILFISHKFEEIFAIADRYCVFRDGVSVGEGPIGESDSEKLIRLMVGRTLDQSAMREPASTGSELLRVEHLARTGEFVDVSFSVRAGEILGIYGLVGAGRTEVAEAVFGLTRADRGTIAIGGVPVTIASPADAIRHGIAYVPEDRQQRGAILPFSIAANISLPNLDSLARGGMFSVDREASLARQWIDALRIKASGPDQTVEDLSGGNQQKVVLAKWLAGSPKVLMLDEPTKGIDVGAKEAVHAVMAGFAQRGNAVAMISSDLPEVLRMSDRILVMRRGRVRALFERRDASAENIVRAATDA